MNLKIEDPAVKKVVEEVLHCITTGEPSRDWRVTQASQRILDLTEEAKEKAARIS